MKQGDPVRLKESIDGFITGHVAQLKADGSRIRVALTRLVAASSDHAGGFSGVTLDLSPDLIESDPDGKPTLFYSYGCPEIYL